MDRAVLTWRVLIVGFLQIVRQHDRSDPALAQRNPDGAIDEMANLRGRRSLFHKGAGDVLEHARQVDLLLVMAAERVARLLTGNRQHRHVVEPCIVQPG